MLAKQDSAARAQQDAQLNAAEQARLDAEAARRDQEANIIKDQNMFADSLVYANDLKRNEVIFSVQVINATNNSLTVNKSGGTENATGSKVTVTSPEVTKTVTVNSTGIAYFDGLLPGTYDVSVEAENYTNCHFIAKVDFDPAKVIVIADNTNGQSLVSEQGNYPIISNDTMNIVNNENRYYAVYYSVQVPVLSTTEKLSTLKGEVTYESDLTNDTRERLKSAEGVKIFAKPTQASFDAWIKAFIPKDVKDNGITQIVYPDLSKVQTIGDVNVANFNYEFKDLVVDPQGQLQYQAWIDHFETNQTAYLTTLKSYKWNKNATYTVIYNDDNGVNSADNGSARGKWTNYASFGFSPIYFSIPDAPEYKRTAGTEPTYTADIDGNKGIATVSVSPVGKGYTKNSTFKVEIVNTAKAGTNGEVEFTVNGDGRVEYGSVTNPGSGFATTQLATAWDLSFEQMAFKGKINGDRVDDDGLVGDKYFLRAGVTGTAKFEDSKAGSNFNDVMSGRYLIQDAAYFTLKVNGVTVPLVNDISTDNTSKLVGQLEFSGTYQKTTGKYGWAITGIVLKQNEIKGLNSATIVDTKDITVTFDATKLTVAKVATMKLEGGNINSIGVSKRGTGYEKYRFNEGSKTNSVAAFKKYVEDYMHPVSAALVNPTLEDGFYGVVVADGLGNYAYGAAYADENFEIYRVDILGTDAKFVPSKALTYVTVENYNYQSVLAANKLIWDDLSINRQDLYDRKSSFYLYKYTGAAETEMKSANGTWGTGYTKGDLVITILDRNTGVAIPSLTCKATVKDNGTVTDFKVTWDGTTDVPMGNQHEDAKRNGEAMRMAAAGTLIQQGGITIKNIYLGIGDVKYNTTAK